MERTTEEWEVLWVCDIVRHGIAMEKAQIDLCVKALRKLWLEQGLNERVFQLDDAVARGESSLKRRLFDLSLLESDDNMKSHGNTQSRNRRDRIRGYDEEDARRSANSD